MLWFKGVDKKGWKSLILVVDALILACNSGAGVNGINATSNSRMFTADTNNSVVLWNIRIWKASTYSAYYSTLAVQCVNACTFSSLPLLELLCQAGLSYSCEAIIISSTYAYSFRCWSYCIKHPLTPFAGSQPWPTSDTYLYHYLSKEPWKGSP